jgi:Uma2 family endonuclease
VFVEEYLATSFPDGDREYLDGVVCERNLGSVPHSALLAILSVHFGQHEKRLGAAVYPSCRLRVGEMRYRVPDICVMLRPFRRDRRALVEVPFVVVEILEPEDLRDADVEAVRRLRNPGRSPHPSDGPGSAPDIRVL